MKASVLLSKQTQLALEGGEPVRKAENIGCGIHFVSVHMQPYYRERFGYKPSSYPNAAWLSERILSLPLFPQMTETDVQDVVRAIRKVISRTRNS